MDQSADSVLLRQRLLKNELGRVLEKITEAISERSQPDGGVEVDRVSGLPDVVRREQLLEPFRLHRVRGLESLLEPGHSQGLGHFLHQDLQKDTAGRRRFIFVEMNDRQCAPRHGVRVEQVGEELGHVPELVGFEAMDGAVLPRERLHKSVPPPLREETEPSGDHPVVALERPLLGAALDQHVHELVLPAGRDVHLG
jgi:hypothetical protein